MSRMLLPNFGRLNIEAASAAVPAVASAAAAAAGANERTDDCLADSTRTKLCPTKERKCATSPSTTTAKATACVHVGAVGAARVLERERESRYKSRRTRVSFAIRSPSLEEVRQFRFFFIIRR